LVTLRPPDHLRQVRFHQLLVSARKNWSLDTVKEAQGRASPELVRQQIATLVPEDVRRLLEKSGIAAEWIFPVPALLEVSPTLVGFFRLLLGAPRKSFYDRTSGLAMFRTMEERGSLTKKQKARLDELCQALAVPIADLLRQMSPAITLQDIQELPLLTLGAQFQGANNNKIGEEAIQAVFLAVKKLVGAHLVRDGSTALELRNSSGRMVRIEVASDPDIRIVETIGKQEQQKVAIEIKGGTDRSNAHNRAGEAEKSHQKAKAEGFLDLWTIIAKVGLDMAKLEVESPTTRRWFDISQVTGQEGADWEDFRQQLALALNLPEAPDTRAR
jgi:hypothetical protein